MIETTFGTRRLELAIALSAVLGACARPAPDTTLAPDLGKRLVASRGMVTSAHPRASEAGLEMLRRGGNAVDAAVAAAFAVSVGEPQMSGLGGGGSMLIWLQGPRRAEYIDFYSAQRPESWRDVPRNAARTDLRRVAIPGEVAGLLEAHERFGKLPRADVLAPAIRLADEGYPINQILAQMIASDSAKLFPYPESRRAYWPDGRRLRVGDQFRNPELAATLRQIAERGRRGFEEGPEAAALIRQLNAGGHPATLADLAAFQPQWKRPMCGEYHGRVILSAAPPQTGLQVIHTLALLEPYDLRAIGLPTRSARAFDILTSAMRVGMTTARYGEDPNWASAPAAGVVAPAYVETRRALVGTGAAAERIAPASPDAFVGAPPTAGCAPFNPYRDASSVSAGPGPGRFSPLGSAMMESRAEGGETTHLSVVDAEGNAVALTQTNSSTFGVGDRAPGGFMLNDSGNDLSRDSTTASPPSSGRHPFRVRRSTIAPTIVLEDGRVSMIIGAPGGGRIPTEILQNMVYMLDYGLDPLEALRLPRIFPSATSRVVQLENGFPATVLGQIRAMGYEPTEESQGYARLYVIVRRDGRWIGAADPRHNGEVRGY
ncbi:MAG TPA: gamma-glutamyltransferase [Gemmatimonadaceae bacterium]|nr:gamma-glutamyltransferase [Gemmatimonadaceae bacterium]